MNLFLGKSSEKHLKCENMIKEKPGLLPGTLFSSLRDVLPCGGTSLLKYVR